MTDKLDFSGKTVLVVGGSSGIGNATAQAFRARGASVHVWGTRASADDYADTEGSDLAGLHYAQVDVSDRASLDGANLPERLDTVVLAQGIVRYNGEEFEREGWDPVIGTNLTSVMDCARKVKPKLTDSGGSLIVVASVAAWAAAFGNPAYGASKAGAVSLVRSLAKAWAREGVRVNGLAPGFVRTKMTDVTFDGGKREEMTLKAIPMRRSGEAEEQADAVLFLASGMASYITGQTLVVDGGLTLH